MAVTLALGIFGGCCFAPAAASAGDHSDASPSSAPATPSQASSAPAPAAPTSPAAAPAAPAPAAPSSVASAPSDRPADAPSDDSAIYDDVGTAFFSVKHWLAPLPPPRPHVEVHKQKAPPPAPLAGPMRWLFGNVSRSLAHADNVANKAGAAALGGPIAWLGDQFHAAPPDQDRARDAVKKGQIVPLSSILKTVQKSVPGDVLKVALNKDVEGSWNYSITVLTPQGFYRDVDVDAGSNQITQIKGH